MESTLDEKTYPFSSPHIKEDIDVNHKDLPLPLCAAKMESKEGLMDVTTMKQEPTVEADDVKCKKVLPVVLLKMRFFWDVLPCLKGL